MSLADSSVDPVAVGRVRALLRSPTRRENPAAAMAAGAFFMLTALCLAVAVISVPPVASAHDTLRR